MPSSTSGKYGVPTRCATIARLPPHSVAFAPMRRTVERALDRPFVVLQHAETVRERERRRRHRAEIVRRHRPGVRHHPAARERRKLEGGEVRMTHPALPRARKRGEVEPVDETREAIAAAEHQRDVRVRDRPRRARSPRAARRRAPKSAASGCARSYRRERDDRGRVEQRLRAIDRRGIGREPGRRNDRESRALRSLRRALPPLGEELRQEAPALVCRNAAGDARVMIEARARRRGRSPSRRRPSSDRARRRRAARAAHAGSRRRTSRTVRASRTARSPAAGNCQAAWLLRATPRFRRARWDRCRRSARCRRDRRSRRRTRRSHRREPRRARPPLRPAPARTPSTAHRSPASSIWNRCSRRWMTGANSSAVDASRITPQNSA